MVMSRQNLGLFLINFFYYELSEIIPLLET